MTNKIIIIVAALLTFSFSAHAQTVCPKATGADSPRHRIGAVENYIVYYGSNIPPDVLLKKLAPYDLLIVQPNTLSADLIDKFKKQGKIVVAYLSVGEVIENDKDPLYQEAKKKKWLFGKKTDWKSYRVNISETEWQQRMIARTDDYVRVKGYDGVFLDTVDTVDAEAKPALKAKLKPGMIALIRGLRQSKTDAIIVQNRGFTIINEVADCVDSIMFEDLSTGYRPKEKKYVTFTPNPSVVQKMIEIGKKLPVLSLDYARPDQPDVACRALQIARSYCFIPAISVGLLDDIPDYQLDKCQAPLCKSPN